MKKYSVLVLLASICYFTASGQTDQQLKAIATETDKQKTANSKDILTTLFRAGIDNLLGDDRSFTFSSSFFGIDSIFRKKGTELNFNKERRLRQNALNIAISGDSNNNITKIGGGFTFTLINDKDITSKSLEKADIDRLTSFAKFTSVLQTSVKKHIINGLITDIRHSFEGNAAITPDSLDRIIKKSTDSLNRIVTDSWRQADKQNDFTNLHPSIKSAFADPALLAIIKNDPLIAPLYSPNEVDGILASMLKGEDVFHEVYKNIAEKYARKPLWTFTPKGVYDRVRKQGEYDFATYFTVGLGRRLDRKPWELELNSTFTIANDISRKDANYDNKLFSISAGVNKVLIENEEKESKMEFKFFTQYDHQFGTVPTGVDKGIFTLNTTLRVNVFKSLWLPLTLKYDPANSNFLGIFAVTANQGN